MLKTTLCAAVLGATALTTLSQTAAAATPAATFTGQWWTHPLGCEYSRAGRPGETIWFLIVNTAKPGCPTYVAGTSWGNIYQKEGPKVRR